MKRKLIALLLLLCLSVTTLTVPTFAQSAPTVRVNGHQVEFPDGKPYIDGNGRTMIPVRFVTEAMKAKVDWVQSTQTAVIQKDGTKVEVTIGQKDIKVTKDGVAATVTMDTEAVITGGRTYVPIRYVAEALGAYVAYSDAYGTVGIYNDVLTADEIETLRAYEYTVIDGFTTYEEAKAMKAYQKAPILLEAAYGKNRETFAYSFENAHEFLYNDDAVRGITYQFEKLGSVSAGPSTMTEFWDKIIEEVRAEINYESEHVKFEVHTDTSMIYMPDSSSLTDVVVRGMVYITYGNDAIRNMSHAEHSRRAELWPNLSIVEGGTYVIPMDFVVGTLYPALTNVYHFEPLSEPVLIQ